MHNLLETEARLSAELGDHLTAGLAGHTTDNPATCIQNRKAFCTAGQLDSVFNRMDALDSKEKHFHTYFRGVNAEVASLANCNIRNKLRIWRRDDHHR